ncbi:MAG: hypothetical protein U0003_00615 [Vampirovibrionales bacterium]
MGNPHDVYIPFDQMDTLCRAASQAQCANLVAVEAGGQGNGHDWRALSKAMASKLPGLMKDYFPQPDSAQGPH